MTIADYIQILILIVLIVTAYVGIREIKEGRKIHEEILDWNRKNKTQDTLNELRKFPNPLLATSFKDTFNNPGIPIPLEIIQKEIEKDRQVKVQIIRRLNAQEGLSRGVYLSLYDEEMVKLSRKTSMTQIFYEYKEFIDERRKVSNPNAWKNYEQLVNKWEKDELS